MRGTGKASLPLCPRWPRRGPSAAPPGHPPLSWRARRLGGAGSPPSERSLASGRPRLACKKYAAEVTPLAGNASRASSFLGLHNRPDFTLPLSVQAQKALARIGQAVNPAERARFKCSRANRRDFPGGRAGRRAARLLRLAREARAGAALRADLAGGERSEMTGCKMLHLGRPLPYRGGGRRGCAPAEVGPSSSPKPTAGRQCEPPAACGGGGGGSHSKQGGLQVSRHLWERISYRCEPAYFAKIHPGLQPVLLYTREIPLTAAGTGAGSGELQRSCPGVPEG